MSIPYVSDDSRPLHIRLAAPSDDRALSHAVYGFNDVCVLWLPACEPDEFAHPLLNVGRLVADMAARLGPQATLVVLGETVDLVQVHSAMPAGLRYQHWIAIRRRAARDAGPAYLPNHHFGALIYTRYHAPLRHTKTRLPYTYCPACGKTTKDYGGKKHTYHAVGTLISDIWRDLNCELADDVAEVFELLAGLFGLPPYQQMAAYDLRGLAWQRVATEPIEPLSHRVEQLPAPDHVVQGDSLAKLKPLPDNSVDFVFTDPPYNLGKNYLGYSDDLNIEAYFRWCDQWIDEIARVLKPGRTFALLNIPLWSIRHFLHLQTVLRFQNWIVWDALAFPARLIMPAHYAILCFSKGRPRPLRTPEEYPTERIIGADHGELLSALGDNYCLRAPCVATRHLQGSDRVPLSDTWTDIHRLKHNSRRVDHPCQLPPALLYRLLALYTRPGETVLDCFDGAGTTTLAAEQMGRHYLGIELSERYCALNQQRHAEVAAGIDPFRKEERVLTAKNSPVLRRPKQKYLVPKKTLQLEVRRIARLLGRLPTRDEVGALGQYPLRYYDEYFAGWGEVCAAARHDGMRETRVPESAARPARQPRLELD